MQKITALYHDKRFLSKNTQIVWFLKSPQNATKVGKNLNFTRANQILGYLTMVYAFELAQYALETKMYAYYQ